MIYLFSFFGFDSAESPTGCFFFSLGLGYQVALYHSGEALRASRNRLGHLVGVGDTEEELLQAVLEELLLHTLITTFKEELCTNTVTLSEPLGGLLGLE